MSNMEASIQALAKRVEDYSETIQTEEAVKTSVILPFLQSLGYDVFNPAEVVPEFTADAVGKKGEKVDYAIMKDGEVSILIECKGLSTQLNEKHLAQLFRYFTVTKARFAILTNGREYRFYSDLEEANKLDRRPFFIFDLLDYAPASISELAKFSRADFDVENILAQAERLKYVSAVKKVLETWVETPSEGLVKLIGAEVYDGRSSAAVREMLSNAITAAFRDLVRDRIRQKLSNAFEDAPAPSEIPANTIPAEKDDGVVTTEEEIEGWLLIKALLRGSVESNRIFMRDAKSYCAILLDDNNRKPLARLHFNRSKKYIGLFDGEAEERMEIGTLDDMFEFRDRILSTVSKY
ncbi:type I restriction enzyme HsdR N-terminal domain-containing protein [Pseudooceanicola sp. CBS1P-1]|uniref:Restriction endonuclease n=1 Tax=Pseudooceanicola albus TaxID=2692189 RepID=A0A6L7G3R8_9RHOB|nr:MULTISPECIES: type I restriction endonuclease [Pseudooceanicola]MBT9382735.1 type I restriction enzyme HsdR N-terminal domain-containing protein [Pseudooceanicola endophyticus]MXN17273.1 restriction endonuclease [Pseudooceanicola albus]